MATETTITKRTVVDVIKNAAPDFAKRLPERLNAERWTMQLATLVQKNPKLLDCTPTSLLLAANEAAELGISLNPILQLGYIIPYDGIAQFQVGYRGLIQKAYEAKCVRSLCAEVVYENDQFSRQFAPKRNLFHAPPENGARGEAIGAYALIEFADGHIDFEYMDATQILRHREHSRAWKKEGASNMLWGKFWEEAWKKTPIRLLFKRLPLTDPGLESLVEVVGREEERDRAEEPAGRLELEPDSPLAKPTPISTPAATAQEQPISHAPSMHDVAIYVGAKDSTITGDVRKIVANLPQLGAKLPKGTKVWIMPSARVHELLKLCDEQGVTYVEVDANGTPVVAPDPEHGSEETGSESLFDA
jgi:recombination protein RecT